MMNGPFFRNYSNQQPSRSSQSVPVRQTQQRSSPKVFSVPVHFISSEKPRTTSSMSKDSAALKIQKLIRGFHVRKSLKKVASIGNEVSEIERRINDNEVVDLIRRDAKERLRVNETLMSLLFKLDSIRGVDFGVRVLRKAVTRKAIELQEKIDSIAQSGQQTLDSPNNDSVETDHQSVSRSTSEHVTETSGDSANLQSAEEDADGVVVKEMVEDCIHGVEESMKTNPTEELTENGKEEDACVAAGLMEVEKEEKGNRELLEKLMVDNGKMMKLMMQISERNEMQTRMINSLSQRVEQLEKAFMADKLRRKKKTRVALRRDKDDFCI